MHRLLILSVMTLCLAGGLAVSAFANDYCPSVVVGNLNYCDCEVHNYSTLADANVTITVYRDNDADVDTKVVICGPHKVEPGSRANCDVQFHAVGRCACKVTGEAPLTRTSLCVDAGDFVPLTCVPCN